MKYIITGASSGIGKRCAERLLDKGHECVIVARSKDKLDSLASNYKGSAHVIISNFNEINSIEKIFKETTELHPFDGMIHCAGIAPLKRIDENTIEIVRNTYTVNVFSFFELMRCFVAEGICKDGGAVVAMSSVIARRGSNRQSVYSGTKAALDAAARCMARELAGRNIRVNTVVSGTVETDMLKKLRIESPNLDEKIKNHSPLGIISTDEVCSLIEFLLSESAAHITGASVPIDSGYLL